MANYRHKTTGEVKTQGQWRADHPNTSLPKVWNQNTLEFLNVEAVFEAPKPNHNTDTQRVVLDGYVQDSKDNWIQNWVVQDLSAEEVTAAQTRKDTSATDSNKRKRDNFLKETDHFGLSDVTMSAEMETYRQALRDITTHTNWPHLDEADWPVKP